MTRPPRRGRGGRLLRRSAGASLVLVALAAGGCTSGGPSGRVDMEPGAPADAAGPEEPRTERAVRIEVTNDLTPPTSIVVHVELNTGARIRLGRVQPGHTETFRYTPQSSTRRIRLAAQTNQGRIVRSDVFTVGASGGVRWNVN